jgi:hypothetical protein
MSAAISSARASSRAAAASRYAARAASGSAAQPGCAAAAAAAAAATSSSLDAGSVATTVEGRIGLCFSYVSPVTAGSSRVDVVQPDRPLALDRRHRPPGSEVRPSAPAMVLEGHRGLLYVVPMDFDPVRDYPLGTKRRDLVRTPGGLPVDALDLHGEGDLASELRATPQTLALQAQVARAAGRTQLADNLLRAAELAPCPVRRCSRSTPRSVLARPPASSRSGRAARRVARRR